MARVLDLVEQVPPGRVTTYVTLADHLGACGPRRIGRILSLHGGGVPWWRVVRSDGTLPAALAPTAQAAYAEEGTPTRRCGKADVLAAYWSPADEDPPLG